jgi:drug/metabolite transporter (DMT)-like permease
MQKIWQGIFWKILSCGCFAGINVLVRYLAGGSPIALSKPLPIYSIMFFQNIIGMLIISLWMWKTAPGNMGLKTDKPWLHALRVITAALGIGLWYVSLRYIPVTQVVALSFVAPIITVIGAILFLKENFNLQRKIAVLLSIFGGFLIARPDQALMNSPVLTWYMLLPLLAAFVFSLDKLLTRQLLVQNESPRALAWYLLTFIAPLCILPMFYYGWVTPSAEHLPWLLVLGALGALAHYSFNKAYELAEVTLLLPFGAAKLILSATVSYMVFYEIPKTFDMWLGIAVITLSTMVLGMKSNIFLKSNLQPKLQNQS